MENQLQLTQEEIGIIELALGETISVCKNRFRDELGSLHPAKKFEDLYDKITKWSEPLPVSTYSLSPNQIQQT